MRYAIVFILFPHTISTLWCHIKDWKSLIEQGLQQQKNKVANINLEAKNVSYSEKFKLNRELKSLTGDEEISRAFLIDRLINTLDYKVEVIEIEKEYSIKAGHKKSFATY